LENSLQGFIFSVGLDGSAITQFHVNGNIAWLLVEETWSTFYVVQAVLTIFVHNVSNMNFSTQNV